ncbi:sensor domain-containing protein [Paracidovorax wautersii]|uniref:PAS domain S-box-containing protein/diguanylate cyclase (GGDEF) domain-containing protein n=1 Tax=Paracidovorax wautersii TaxID=1177982 RepID=A0A1I2CMA8_9BURK|nr:EAL domain-containing protein [Paracidovorax wautersii]SFE69364.1 PAS domain S-box-containing protein/diguanylate cyclase (GGDEF) domain-containing protein [Paracidovorax wautersii]
MNPNPVTAPARPQKLPDEPALTVLLVLGALALLLVPVSRMLGAGMVGPWGLASLFGLVVVLLGLVGLALSAHALDPEPDRRLHCLVGGLTVACTCGFMQAVVPLLENGGAAAVLARSPAVSFFNNCARMAEGLAFLLLALGVRLAGSPRLWMAGAGGVSIGLVWIVASGLPERLSAALTLPWGSMVLGLGVALLALAAVLLWRLGRREPAPIGSLLAAAAMILAASAGMSLAGRLGLSTGEIAAHMLRMLAYALVLQVLFISSIRRPYAQAREVEARLRESEMRLQLLGRNLPDSITYQIVREHDGRRRFVYMGEALERLIGVRVEDAVNDPTVLYERILPEDREDNLRKEEESFRRMSVSDNVVRVRRTDGEVRWIRMSSSPRDLPDGRVIWDGVATDVTEQREAELMVQRRDLQLGSLLRSLPGGVARIGPDRRVLYVNPLQAQWLQSEPGEMEGRPFSDFMAPDVMKRLSPHLDRAFAGHTAVFESRIDYPDGPQFRHTTFAPEVGPDGRVVAVVSFAYDLTAQRRMAHELDQQRSRLAGLVNAIPDMVFLKDAEGRYLSANPAVERFLGRSAREIMGKTDDAFWSPAEARRMHEQDQRAMGAPTPLVFEEELTFDDDGAPGFFETLKTAIRDAHGNVTGVLGVRRDITDRKKAKQEIERLAFYDALTGLPNRRLLLDRLQRACAVSQRSEQLGALFFIDLDNFKDLNDTLGHDMGDRLLAQVAQRLVASVRATDTVSRFGGDEFVVMLEDLDAVATVAAEQAESIADNLMQRLNEPFELGAQQYYSTPSIGITLFGDQRRSVDELLKRADLAMYQAKAAGRNTQRFFDPHMQALVNARSHLEAELRQGLARGELRVHYQPVMDERTRICGAEALVRWPHPQRGMISPAEFIPLAEQTGLILPLGRFVLRTACEQLVRWSRRPDTRHLSVSVNVSARQFRQPGFVSEVLDVLRDTGAEPRHLKLELTESMLLGDIEDTIGRMTQLKNEGVGFSLDDFGTGYSSLSYLKRLPLDQVKIDQSFVRDVLTDPNDAAIVRTILALADSLDLDVVAEGVETTGQLAFLKLHGCSGFQGYLFGRPDTPEVLEASMARALP